MAGRHSLRAVVLFAVMIHAIAISQTLLPAQDGLKFIRIAREFRTHPWADVVRGSVVHPLYPGLIAAVEPVVALFTGEGPGAWRTAAQLVAVIASVGLILPIYGLTKLLFDRRIACVAAALAVLLPRAAELGHDTLSDSLGLLCMFVSLWLGALALRNGDWRAAAGSGLAGGFGYLARPEVILVPLAIGLTWIFGLVRDGPARALARIPAMAVLLVCTLAVASSYALVKGEISEKLTVRVAASLGPHERAVRRVPQQVPAGLDDPRLGLFPEGRSRSDSDPQLAKLPSSGSSASGGRSCAGSSPS